MVRKVVFVPGTLLGDAARIFAVRHPSSFQWGYNQLPVEVTRPA